MKSGGIRFYLMGTSLLSSAWSFAAVAQDVQRADAGGEVAMAAANTSGEIVVTGSLIRNPNVSSATPVTSIGEKEIQLRQSLNAEQLVRDIPGSVAGMGNNNVSNNPGASTADLRGLGSNRNIVLLNGQRIVPYGLEGVTDLNVIPLALIQRTDVLTGGASTTYGADAISGVVNFVTRRDFTGLDLSASGGISDRGDGQSQRLDATVGFDLGHGRGNIAISGGYQKQDGVTQSARKWAAYPINSYTGAIGGSSSGVPSRLGSVTTVVDGSTVTAISGTTQIDPATGTAVTPYSLYNYDQTQYFQTPYERYNLYAAGHYDLTDNIEIYGRGMYSKTKVSAIIAESGAFGISVQVPFSNPYLPTGLLNQICNGAGLTAAQCSAAASATSTSDANYRTFTTSLSRRAAEAGGRTSDFSTTLFDFNGGLRGDIGSSLHWDVHGSYGESSQVRTIKNYTLVSRIRDAVLATSTDSCLSGNAGCVPLNIFGAEGTITDEMLSYLTANSTVRLKTTLAQAHGELNGSLPIASPFAEDKVQFAVGAEYRSYTASQTPDSLAATGDLGGAAVVAAVDGAYSVYEGFAEIDAPLIQNKPFFEMLDLQAGIRRSQYNIDANGSPSFGTTTWKAGVNWKPVRDLKLRGNFQHAVRAPNISELFSPITTGVSRLAVDPCAGSSPLTNANLAAICVAQGAPASTIGAIENPTSSQANLTTGGNANLKPEKSDSFTIGAVFQPSFIPGLTISADYYRIKITDAITSPTTADLVNACFGSITASSASSSACTIIRRNPLTGSLDGDSTVVSGLYGTLSNLGTIKTDGIDFSANYTRNLDFATLSLSFNGNWTNRSQFQATPTSVNRECVGYFSANCALSGSLQPRWSWNQRTTLSFSKLDVSLNWRHLSSFEQEPLSVTSSTTAYVGTLPSVTGLDGTYDFGRIKAYDAFDLTTRVTVSKNYDLTFSVFNLFDRNAPLVGDGIGAGGFSTGNTYPSTYDTIGRRFMVTAHARF